LLAYLTGLVNQRLLLQCEYLIAESPLSQRQTAPHNALCGCTVTIVGIPMMSISQTWHNGP
jgi:hypothetical protein